MLQVFLSPVRNNPKKKRKKFHWSLMITVILRKFLGTVMRLGNDKTDGSDRAGALLTCLWTNKLLTTLNSLGAGGLL